MYCDCYRWCRCPRYGAGAFLFDLFMIVITGGLWVFWIIYKFGRSSRYRHHR